MPPFSSAIVAVALFAAPIPALAQAWPASGAAGAPALADRRDGVALATARVAAWSMARETAGPDKRRIVLSTRSDAEAPRETPEVEVRARSEWLYQDGLRIGAKGVAYTERF